MTFAIMLGDAGPQLESNGKRERSLVGIYQIAKDRGDIPIVASRNPD
jgi:hypothetical protein